MRVRVYIDGFNLYYRALQKSPYKWLNFVALAQNLVEPTDDIGLVRYFTTRISPRAGDLDAPRRQQIYLSAIRTLPQVTIHYGNFLPKQKWRPIVHPSWDPKVSVQVHDTEEKGSDVNLASHLLNDGWQDQYDLALVFTQDTDFCTPIEMVTQELKKTLGLVWLDGRQPSPRLAKYASFVRHITPSRLAAAQFPNRVMGNNGHLITKPTSW